MSEQVQTEQDPAKVEKAPTLVVPTLEERLSNLEKKIGDVSGAVEQIPKLIQASFQAYDQSVQQKFASITPSPTGSPTGTPQLPAWAQSLIEIANKFIPSQSGSNEINDLSKKITTMALRTTLRQAEKVASQLVGGPEHVVVAPS